MWLAAKACNVRGGDGMIAHLCPRCLGEKQILNVLSDNQAVARPCPTCNGDGVIWQIELKDVPSGPKAGDSFQKTSAGEIH